MEGLIYIIVVVVFVFGLLGALFSRYKKCPSDKILVKYGKWEKAEMEKTVQPAVFMGVLLLFGQYFNPMLFWI